MFEYIFVTNIFEYSNIRIYSSHSGLNVVSISNRVRLQMCWRVWQISNSASNTLFKTKIYFLPANSSFNWFYPGPLQEKWCLLVGAWPISSHCVTLGTHWVPKGESQKSTFKFRGSPYLQVYNMKGRYDESLKKASWKLLPVNLHELDKLW